jgi:hypothetical protein
VNVISYLFTVIIAAASVGFTVWGFSAGPRRLSATKEKGDSCPPAAFHKPAPMTKRDFLPLAVICLVYGALAL